MLGFIRKQTIWLRNNRIAGNQIGFLQVSRNRLPNNKVQDINYPAMKYRVQKYPGIQHHGTL